ncbi:MAG TPA: hypothetical protein V6D48_22920 [Oculatellaceae cyanobacterium]
MTKRKPNNPNKPDIIVYVDGAVYEISLAPGTNVKEIAAGIIEAVENPEKPKPIHINGSSL